MKDIPVKTRGYVDPGIVILAPASSSSTRVEPSAVSRFRQYPDNDEVEFHLILQFTRAHGLPADPQFCTKIIDHLVARARLPAAAPADRRVFDLGDDFRRDKYRARLV
jgi:hypothetical protein